MAYNPVLPKGQAAMADSAPVVIANNQSAVPVSFTGSTDVATQTTLAAINTKLVSGTDIGDVTINNSTGGSAVNIQDGGNTITVDGAVTVSGTATVNVISGFATSTIQTDGTQTAGIRSITKSTSTGAGITSTAASTTRQPLDVTVYKNDGTALDPTQIRALTSSDVVTVSQATAANLKVDLSGTAANTTALKVNVASGGIASGAIASGAIASGAVASGAIASGAIAAGAIAAGAAVAGAFVDGSDVTIGSKTDAKSTATDGTSVTIMQVLKEISAMEQAPASRAVTNTGTFAVQATTTRTSLTAAAATYATVGVTSAEAVATNANRKGLILVNTSAGVISLCVGAAAVLYSGITLYPMGSYTMSEYDFTTGQFRAIASVAGSNLAIQEYT